MPDVCDLSIVIPLYDEAACVSEAITQLAAALDVSGLRYELIAVDNGSRDSTHTQLARLAAGHRALRVLHFDHNQGFGGAILAGLDAAHGRVRGFTCGDGEVPSSAVLTLYRVLVAGDLELVKGKRVKRRDGSLRKAFSVGYHLAVGLFLGVHTTDVNGYPVLMTETAYRRLAPRSRDWMINAELLVRARRLDLAMSEVDVAHRPRLAGHSKVRLWFPLLFVAQLARLRRRI